MSWLLLCHSQGNSYKISGLTTVPLFALSMPLLDMGLQPLLLLGTANFAVAFSCLFEAALANSS